MLRLPQVGRVLNPSLLEGLISNLETLEPAYLRNLSLEGSLSLSHSQIIGLLLGLFLGAFNLRPGEHRLIFNLLGLVPGPLNNFLGPFCLS